jgi:hypothetical protein
MTHFTVNTGTPVISARTLTTLTIALDPPSRHNPTNRRSRATRFNGKIGTILAHCITDNIAQLGKDGTKRINLKSGIIGRNHIKIANWQLRHNRNPSRGGGVFPLQYKYTRAGQEVKQKTESFPMFRS